MSHFFTIVNFSEIFEKITEIHGSNFIFPAACPLLPSTHKIWHHPLPRVLQLQVVTTCHCNYNLINNFSIIACGEQRARSCATVYLLMGAQHTLRAGIVRDDWELFHQIITMNNVLNIRIRCQVINLNIRKLSLQIMIYSTRSILIYESLSV